ncbi:hypothetical protein NN561_020316 [Cricetulus griseus]
MALILHEGEASVFHLVCGTGINDHIEHALGDLGDLLQDLPALLHLRDTTDEEAAVVHAAAHTQQAAWADLIVVELTNSSARLASCLWQYMTKA